MLDPDRPVGGLRQVPLRSARRQARPARPLPTDEEPVEADALGEPARGIVLGLAPALLLWAALIALAAKLLR